MQTQSSLHAAARTHRGKKWLLFVVLVGIVVGLDQGTKRAVHKTFKLYESRPVVASFVNLTYVRNSGAAFGLLSRQNPVFIRLFFLSVTFVALVILLFYYARVPWEQTLTLWGLCLIASGALGNGIDRLWLGQVIDFIDVYVSHYHWPAFNVADSAICVGVGCLLLDTVRHT
jgi:signal peptidase II